MALSSSHYRAVGAPYVHFLPEYRPQFNVSSPTEDEPKFVIYCILSENLHTIWFRRVSTSSTGDEHTNDFKWPHKQKFSGVKSGGCGGQATCPPLLIRRPGNFRFRYVRATRLVCAGAPSSCMKRSSRRMISGTWAEKSGLLFSI
jgi:hypothetical protein